MILSQKSEPSAQANPRRGYHDSVRTVCFSVDTPDAEQKTVMDKMRADLAEHNMWAYAPRRADGIGTWTINYGYDSGD